MRPPYVSQMLYHRGKDLRRPREIQLRGKRNCFRDPRDNGVGFVFNTVQLFFLQHDSGFGWLGE